MEDGKPDFGEEVRNFGPSEKLFRMSINEILHLLH
jgi:hypothetical protein